MKTDTKHGPSQVGQILKKSTSDAGTIGFGPPAWVKVDQGGRVVAVDRGLLERCAERDQFARLALGILDYAQRRGPHSCALGEYPPPPGSHVHRLNYGEDDQT